jgi:hypothetical protein
MTEPTGGAEFSPFQLVSHKTRLQEATQRQEAGRDFRLQATASEALQVVSYATFLGPRQTGGRRRNALLQ